MHIYKDNAPTTADNKLYTASPELFVCQSAMVNEILLQAISDLRV